MKSRLLKWVLVVVLSLLALFIFASGVIALMGQENFIATVGNFLLDWFSYGLFLIPIWLFIIIISLASKQFPTKDGALIAVLMVPFVVLASFWLSLVFPRDVAFYNQIVETVQTNHGSFVYVLYLSLFFFVVLLTCLAPLRVFILTIDEKFQLGFEEKRKSKKKEKALRAVTPEKIDEPILAEPNSEINNVDSNEFEEVATNLSEETPIQDSSKPHEKRKFSWHKKEKARFEEKPLEDESNVEAEDEEKPNRRFDFLKRLEEEKNRTEVETTKTILSDVQEEDSDEVIEIEDDGNLASANHSFFVFDDETNNIETEEDEAFDLDKITYESVGKNEASTNADSQVSNDFAQSEEAKALLNRFPNVKRLLDVVEAEKQATTEEPQYDFSDIQGEDMGLKMLEDSYAEESFEEGSDADFGEDNDIDEMNDLDDEDDEDEESEGVVGTLFDDEELDSSDSESIEKEETRFEAKPYFVPIESTLKKHANAASWEVDEETRQNGELLQKTLEEFNIQAEVIGIQKGPVITMYEILPAPGVKLSKIAGLSDNIALRLAAPRVRIVAPIPGKHAVGIEIPNRKRALVGFREMVEDPKFDDQSIQIPVILGKDVTGNAQIIDLAATPHLLIAGATGSGKSVCVNSLITSILFKKRPDQVKLLLIDPKIVELKLYNDVPHLLTPVITEPKKAFQALQYCLAEMERRYSLLDSLGCRDIKSFNKKAESKKFATEKLPYIVVIVDEFADLMATTGKELESTLARLAAMSRAVGIHLVLATQRPSIDVITGIIKANIPSRIAFMVAGKMDSRIILDTVGAENLLGKGDMLFAPSWDPTLTRIQGAFLSDEEVEQVVAHVKTLGEPEYIDDEIFIDDDESNLVGFSDGADDPLMNRAIEVVCETGKASASFLQRRLKVGYNRAARMVEEMERQGIIGPQNGSKPREVLNIPKDFGNGNY